MKYINQHSGYKGGDRKRAQCVHVGNADKKKCWKEGRYCVCFLFERKRVNLGGQKPKRKGCMWKRARVVRERGQISLAAYKAQRASHFRQKWILAVRNDDNTPIKHLKVRKLSVVFVGALERAAFHSSVKDGHIVYIWFSSLFLFFPVCFDRTGKYEEGITGMFTTNWVTQIFTVRWQNFKGIGGTH